MTAVEPRTAEATTRTDTVEGRARWPLYGVAAGLLGLAATLFTDPRMGIPERDAVDASVLSDLSRGLAHVGLVAGFLTVALLLVLAAAWRRQVEPRVPGSTAAHVVSGALVASAAGLTYGYAWKGALAIYLPTGSDAGPYGDDGLFVYFMLNDFGPYIGWLGVVVAAGAVAWMGLRERTVSRWIGVLSLGPVVAVTGLAGATGLPGFQGLAGPAWLLAACTGLAAGRSTIVR
ncbi:hypothetical protein GCM10010329_59830 [Streptomyces spiroverticillatus]|uniref:DUF4386 family protein n=1 Tax=Streptomyces finlayi TaxID=67296 RepID=A0A919CCZ1_9ACTN|nr:hypothetical protein [Streptomyces finlayi]GHA28651.1 hypothetical protein GCM10010329_59830 [Streptomyces spiroverticillatus]GHD09303.1 hypothetical protein GCM10010334_63490 [Streptomyces finlayi]